MYKLIRTQEQYKDFCKTLNKDKRLFCDTETYQDQGRTKGGLYGKIRLYQFYQEGWKDAAIVDCMFIPLKQVLEDVQDYHHVYHNASYDLHTVNCYTDDVWLPRELDDTVYLSRLVLYQKTSKFGFYECLKALRLNDGIVQGIDKKENQKADWGGPLSDVMLKYAACDVLYLSLLYDEVIPGKGTESYALDIVNLKYAIEYSRRGIPVDQDKVNEKLLESMTQLEDVMRELPVNPNSPKQCKEYLGTEKTDMDTLVHLALKGSVPAQQIRDARQLSKTVGFLKKYSREVVKGFYNPCGAVSGRFSCTGGDSYEHNNLQQIPRRILDCLVALSGRILVYKDYAGLELRMAAAWVGEPTMCQMIFDGVDLHSYTGSILFNKNIKSLTKHERMIGKICNFLLIYGGGVAQFQSTMRAWGGILMEFKEVKILRDKWFKEYAYFEEWHSMNKRHLGVYGYLDVETALGRGVRTYKINDALNVPIQGSSAEVTKTSLKYLKERYPDENLISTIHDSNTLMTLDKDKDLWVSRLNECMIDAWYYVIKGLAVPDLPMPPEAEYSYRWDF